MRIEIEKEKGKAYVWKGDEKESIVYLVFEGDLCPGKKKKLFINIILYDNNTKYNLA